VNSEKRLAQNLITYQKHMYEKIIASEIFFKSNDQWKYTLFNMWEKYKPRSWWWWGCTVDTETHTDTLSKIRQGDYQLEFIYIQYALLVNPTMTMVLIFFLELFKQVPSIYNVITGEIQEWIQMW